MKTITIVGIIIIVLGVVGLIYGGLTYTYRKDAVDMGPMHIQVDQNRQIPISPIAGAAAVAIGVLLILFGRRRHASGNAL
jgi:hypothetical protein